ncbi:MAG: polyprenyl synthetase family protein [Crocinitomicaceae bacterium]|nr:polyprenyl synthetase family protein [Crocinitomicaceae bacterium]
MNTIEKLQNDYNQFLANNSFQGLPNNLYNPMNYIMSLGGKRVRPLLAMIGNQLAGGEIQNGIYVGHVMEVFHNFSLVHDDIMDKADTRRGMPTVHKKWDEPTAILSGDNMLIKAYELLINYTGPNKDAILKTFTTTAAQVCEGQQNDMDFEQRVDVDIDSYLHMIQNKTAVLLGCSIKCGALSANCNEEICTELYDFAINIGMAFQLMDDYLDTFGNSDNTGKIKGGDILQGKKTWLFLNSQHIDQQKHQELFSQGNSATKVDIIVSHWQEIELDKQCLQLIENYNNKAHSNLERIEKSGFDTQILIELLNYLSERQN